MPVVWHDDQDPIRPIHLAIQWHRNVNNRPPGLGIQATQDIKRCFSTRCILEALNATQILSNFSYLENFSIFTNKNATQKCIHTKYSQKSQAMYSQFILLIHFFPIFCLFFVYQSFAPRLELEGGNNQTTTPSPPFKKHTNNKKKPKVECHFPQLFVWFFFSDLLCFSWHFSTPLFWTRNLVVSDARLNHQISRIFEVDHTLQRNVSARTPVENPGFATRSFPKRFPSWRWRMREKAVDFQGYENWRDGTSEKYACKHEKRRSLPTWWRNVVENTQKTWTQVEIGNLW